jgi:competence protein ComEC
LFCAFAVLLIELFVVLNIGFWLSFAAVFGLLYAFSCRRPLIDSVLASAFYKQWVVYLGMLPWMLYLLYQLSWSSFLVNIVAIPWIGVLVIPLLLIAITVRLLIPAVGMIGATLYGKLLAVIWLGIEWAASFNLVFYRPPPTVFLFALAIVGVLVVLSPKGLLPKRLGFICLLPIFFVMPQMQSRLHVSFIDVGQGLSVLVKTPSETLLYDTGMASDSFNAGEQIVTPFLRRENIKRIDHLVINNGDNDHAGGGEAIS